MFGPIMEFTVDKPGESELVVRLAPLTHEGMAEFIRDGGMQQYAVTRYLGRQFSPVLEDELEWFDKIRADASNVVWGIYVRAEDGPGVVDGWQLIGNTSLNSIEHYGGLASAVSGFMIFRPEFWKKGIASHAHRARTMFAFDQLALTTVRSAVLGPNEGSYRALLRAGYVLVSVDRNETFRDGYWMHKCNLLLVNPGKSAWSAWWHGDEAPEDFRQARERSRGALHWAHEKVHLL